MVNFITVINILPVILTFLVVFPLKIKLLSLNGVDFFPHLKYLMYNCVVISKHADLDAHVNNFLHLIYIHTEVK